MAIRDVFERLVFSAEEHEYRWADVVAAARAWSRWGEITRQTGAGLAALERLAEPIARAELDEAGQEFRYARALLAAEEMEAWLERWAVSQADWLDYLRRRLARSREREPEAAAAPSDEEVWAEAVCSGALSEIARELAALVAAAEADGRGPGPVETDLARMEEALAAFTRAALRPEAAAKTLELRSADWVRVTFTELTFGERGMASEAALCVREDGLSLSEVADRAGVVMQERESFIEEVGAGLSKTLLSTSPGELVGPLPVATGFALVRVNEKVPPTLEDPVIQERLQEEVPRRALEREVRNRVRWHERL